MLSNAERSSMEMETAYQLQLKSNYFFLSIVKIKTIGEKKKEKENIFVNEMKCNQQS